jgi:hypothetical protein
MRNFLHILIGATIGYLMSLTFSGVPLLAQFFFGALFSGVLGTMWEWVWQMYNKSVVDYKDVARAVIPCLIVILWQYLF